MGYVVVHQFIDKVDNERQYLPGDPYPRTGVADNERVTELLAYEIPLIEPADTREVLQAQEEVEITESEEI